MKKPGSKMRRTRVISDEYTVVPGHMTKARRAMKEDMKLIDLVIELVDRKSALFQSKSRY